MSRRSPLLLWALLLLVPLACTDRSGESPVGPSDADLRVTDAAGITVMSQNLYLGANIDLLLSAKTPEDIGTVFDQLTTSTLAGNFGRAQRLARQIAFGAPHLVGLQEVTRYDMTTGAGTQTLDFMYVLDLYLNYFHGEYGTPLYRMIRNDLTTVTFTASMFGDFPDVTYTDGDAILVREDVTVIGDPIMKPYGAYEVFSVAGESFNYYRGYVAVTAEIGGQRVRFGNTHLEVQHFPITQVAQAAELIEAFEGETLPVILVGDFNSAANPHAPDRAKTDSYRMFREAGYADLWLREPHSVGGETCCHDPYLTDAESVLTERLDLVLVRWGPAGFGGQTAMEVIGEEVEDRIQVVDGLWLWPSDHAGVVATLWAAPGRTRRGMR